MKKFLGLGVDVNAQDENGKTAEQIAEDIKEEEMAAFLKACASGKIPAKAPAAKVFYPLLSKCNLFNTLHLKGSRAERIPRSNSSGGLR